MCYRKDKTNARFRSCSMALDSLVCQALPSMCRKAPGCKPVGQIECAMPWTYRYICATPHNLASAAFQPAFVTRAGTRAPAFTSEGR